MPTLRANAPLARDLRRCGLPASRAENDALLPRVRAKEPAAIKRMIEGNLPLVVRKCRAFVRNRPTLAHLADDMQSAGFIALIDAVHNLANAEPGSNATGYLSVAINGAFRSFTASPVSCPPSTRWRREAKGEHLPETVSSESAPEPSYDPAILRDLHEEILACCRPGTADREICRLRVSGFTDAEIAERIGKPPSTVYAARKSIETRFRARQLCESL